MVKNQIYSVCRMEVDKKTVKDPVCGMDVDPKTVAKSEYMGKTYYFCSLACKKTFDKDPNKYVKGVGTETSGHMGHHM